MEQDGTTFHKLKFFLKIKNTSSGTVPPVNRGAGPAAPQTGRPPAGGPQTPEGGGWASRP
jgi:hypothetical protein